MPVRFPAENFMTELVVLFIVSLVIVAPAYIWIIIYGRKDIHENEAILNADIVTNNEDEFRLAVDGSVSKDVLASGELKALEPVSYPEVAGGYLSVVKVIEHYNQYQTGVLLWRKTHYRWEEYGREEKKASSFSFLGQNFDIFYLELEHDIDSEEHLIAEIPVSDTIRHRYYGIKANIEGTVFYKTKEEISKLRFYEKESPKVIMDRYRSIRDTRNKIVICSFIIYVILCSVMILIFL